MKLTNEEIRTKYPEAAERIIGERKVIRRLVTEAIAKGYSVSVNSGEDWEIKNSRSLKDVMDNIMATDEDYLRLTGCMNEIVCTFRMIYGNSPEEVIADHSTNSVAQYLYKVAHKRAKDEPDE